MSKLDKMIKELCPEGVEYVKLVNVANVLYGCPFDATLFSEDDSFIPLIRIRDVVTGIPSTYYSGEYSEQYIIHKGDILVGMDGNFNLGRWNDRDGVLCQRTCKIESKDEKIVVNNYLFHLLGPIFKVIEDNTPGGSVKHLSAKVINAIEIPLPPLPIQQKIVSVLDSFTTLIDKMKQEVEKRKKQMEYYREKLLTFEDGEANDCHVLDILSQPITDGPHETPKFQEHGIPFISVDAIVNNEIDFNKKRGFISAEYDEMCSKKYKPKKNDIYVVKSGSTVGKVAIVKTYLRFNIWSPLAALRTNCENNAKFLFYLLQTNSVQQEIKERSSNGSQPNLSMRTLEKINIKIPPLSKQREIVSTLDKFESYITKLEKMIVLRQKQYEYYREQLLTFE